MSNEEQNESVKKAFAAQNPTEEFEQPPAPAPKVLGSAEELVQSLSPGVPLQKPRID